MDRSELSPNYIIPVGTQVVLKADLWRLDTGGEAAPGLSRFKKTGSVGRVDAAPADRQGTYEVVFADGARVRAAHHELAVRRTLAPEDELPERPVREYERHLIYRVLLGSRAYGLAVEDSDRDERGIYLPPAEWHWSLKRVPEQLEFKVTRDGQVVDSNTRIDSDDHCWWELEKFLRLALKANPTALEVIYVDEAHVIEITAPGSRLRELRDAFLSRHLYHTYSGYVLSQFRRMQRDEGRGKPYRPKHAMHLIRLLHAGIAALEGRGILVDASQHRDELLAIKNSPPALETVHRRALELAEEFQRQFESTALPDHPDVETVNDFLITARRGRV